jgi:hypothetical protein
LKMRLKDCKSGYEIAKCWFMLCCVLFGCANENEQTVEQIIQTSLDAIGKKSDREQIKNLVSLADCISPNGKYTTEIHTAQDGYSYFKQVYSYRPVTFEAVIENKTNGYVIGDSIKPMSREAIYTIRGHEFHNIQLEVDQRFHDLGEPEIMETNSMKTCQLKAKDELNNDCLLLFDVKTGLLSAIHFQNPDSTKEIIKTSFSNWKKVQELLLPHHVDIDQSGKLYSFDFTNISFNSPDFKYRNVKK